MKKILFFLGITALVFFWGAFSMQFFNDDFYFLKITRQFDFLAFFSPIRTTFYRPLASEVFYFFLQRVPYPMIAGHLFVFGVFLLGVYFLFKTIHLLTKNRDIALFSSTLYLFHFSHVYQLYWFATFQEVAQFALLVMSLYFMLHKRFALSIGIFILALFAKEQAILFPFIAFPIYFMKFRKVHRLFFVYMILDIFFIGIHFFVNKQMPVLPEYVIHLDPKLFINNTLWYGLWSLGFPAMMSDYMRSIFSLPFGDFWNYFGSVPFRIYFFGMMLYNVLLALCFAFILLSKSKEKKWLTMTVVLCVSLFLFFLLPVLPIIHKWMVRLTIPLIFTSMIGGSILGLLWKTKGLRPVVLFFLALYLVWNFFGIKEHEVISTYRLESRISKNAEKVFADTVRFANCNSIYIQDPAVMKMGSWDGSEKIALTLSGESFASHYLKQKKDMKVYYEYKTKNAPKGSCVVSASELMK